MDKEQFKISIMHQFRISDAPIKTLMLSDWKSTKLADTVYRPTRTFSCPEFNTIIRINSIVSIDETKFQILFEDSPTKTDLHKAMLINGEAALRGYFQEYVSTHNGQLIFTVMRLQLVEEDYVYTYAFDESYILTYDLAKKKFSGARDVNNFINLMRDHRNLFKAGYVDYLSSVKQEHDLISKIYTDVSTNVGMYIANMLNAAKNDASRPQMSLLIRVVQDLLNEQNKPF